MPRFSLKGFLAAVAFFALIVATLHHPEPYLTGTMALIVLGSMVTAMIMIVSGGLRHRPFPCGFLIAGLAFLVASIFHHSWNPFMDVRNVVSAIAFPIHDSIVPVLARRHAPPGATVTRQGDVFIYSSGQQYGAFQEFDRTETTIRFAIAMMLGLLGGCLAKAIKKRDERLQAPTSQAASQTP